MAHPLCPAPCFPFFFLPFFYTSSPLFNTSLRFFLHTFLIFFFFFFLSPLSPYFSPPLLLLAFFSLFLSPLSSLLSLFFFPSNQPLSLPAHQPFSSSAPAIFFRRESPALSLLKELIVPYVLRELLVCVEGIACTVCLEGVACTVCLL